MIKSAQIAHRATDTPLHEPNGGLNENGGRMKPTEAKPMAWIDLNSAIAAVNLSKATLIAAMKTGKLKHRRSKGDRGKYLTTLEYLTEWIMGPDEVTNE